MLVTTNTKNRIPFFSDDGYARTAIENLYSIQNFYPFFLYAFVVMPDHCHILLSVPEGGSVSKIIGLWKRATSFNTGQTSLWQARFHIRTINNISGAIRYIHQNPIEAKLCDVPHDYVWSSACGKWDIHEYNDM